MYRKNPDVDIINNVLQAVLAANPNSQFIQSLSIQYQERGGLSKKQLEGLHKKAIGISTIPQKWLATVEAEILKKPTRFKSAPPPIKPLYEKDEHAEKMITSILEKFPLHKRVIFFRSKYNNNEPLSAAELTELDKFYKLLL